MLRIVRAKIASTVAGISIAEDYSWHKWLKTPESEKIFFPQPTRVKVFPPTPLKKITPPEQNNFVFSFLAPKLISSSSGIIFKEPVTNTFRLKLNRQLVHKYNFVFSDAFNLISDKSAHLKYQTITQLFANINIKAGVSDNFWCDFFAPDVYDKLSTLNANIIHIALLNEKGYQFSKKIYRIKFILDKKNQKYYRINSLILNPSKVKEAFPFQIPIIIKTLNYLYPVSTSWVGQYEMVKIDSPSVLNSNFLELITLSNIDNNIQLDENILQPPIINEEVLADNSTRKVIENELSNKPEVLIPSSNRELLICKFLSAKYKYTVERLMRQKEISEIHSILIICGKNEFKRASKRKFFNFPEGWVENLESANLKKIEILPVNTSDRKELWHNTEGATITSYEILSKDLIENLISYDLLNSFDLIILDEFHLELESHFSLIRKVSKFRNDLIWYVSTGSKEFLTKESQKILPESLNLNTFNSSETDIKRDKNRIQDYWLRLENLQRVDYEEILASAKKEMMEILKEGNPFRFQSNIFSQIHKLKQACNFSVISNESSKANILLQHIQIILTSGRKVIVSSQYDNLGIKMLEKVLNHSSIRFITMKNSVSETDYKKFAAGKVNVMIFNGRLSKLKISGENNPSIILFDNWWNPINNWHLENNLMNNLPGEIEIINYQIRNTIDETIFNKLMEKYLLDKNLMETMQADNFSRLITEEDWLEIIDVQNTFLAVEKIEAELKPFTKDYFISLINQFLRKLGYENINIEPGYDNNEFVSNAEHLGTLGKIVLNCFIFFDEYVSAERVEEYINELKRAESPPDKIIIFCSGKTELNKSVSDFTSVIDGEKLKSYKKTFGLL